MASNVVRIRNGMTNATEGDILGGASDFVKDLGVVDKAGNHLKVTENSPRGMSVQVAGGIVYVPNSNYSELDSDTPKFYPVVCSAEVLTVDNNVSGSTRVDIVCVKVDKVIVPDADADNIATKVVIKGTPGGGVPATPANHYKLAEITVVNGETEIENSMITDRRGQVFLSGKLITPSGVVVGTTDTQTLTNKTLTNPKLNEDVEVTIKASELNGMLSSWIPALETWTYASATTFTIGGDKTGKYQKGDKIKLTQTTVKYFRITNITYSSPNTTITVDGFGIYTVANASITSPYFSKADNPQGFPQKEVVLFSGTPAASITLSETSANFDYLDIWYEGNNVSGIMGVPRYYTKLDMAVGNIFTMAVDMGNIDSAYKIRTSGSYITASGTSLTITGSSTNYSTDTASNNSIVFSDVKFIPKITKVIGYRW